MVRRRFRELDSGNAGILDELFTTDYRLHFPGRGSMDLAATKRFYAELYGAFPDLRHEIVDQVCEGDRVVTRWNATGTHRGAIEGIAPTNRPVTFSGINIYTIRDDKLAESHVCWDMLGVLDQIEPGRRRGGRAPAMGRSAQASVLTSSRVPISLVPDELMARAAEDEGLRLAELRPGRDGDSVVFERPEAASQVLSRALRRWADVVPLWSRLEFTMQHQEQTQWCWAATSVSVALYYLPASGWTQCAMVNAELGQTTCCQAGSSPQCNQPHVLDAPLARARVFDRMQWGDISYDAIRAEIDAGRPVAWRIGWSGGGGHFAVIEGYRRLGGQWVAIDDPWYGQSDLELATITGGGYQGSGDWTHTYFTGRPPIVQPSLPDEQIRLPWEVWERVTRQAEWGIAVGGEQR